jgi:hypothetical protein
MCAGAEMILSHILLMPSSGYTYKWGFGICIVRDDGYQLGINQKNFSFSNTARVLWRAPKIQARRVVPAEILVVSLSETVVSPKSLSRQPYETESPV